MPADKLINIITILLCIAGIGIFLLRRRRLYTITSTHLLLNGIINRRIAIAAITTLRPISWDELGTGWRFGARFANGAHGMFYFEGLGEVKMHVNDESKMVLIVADDAPCIISVDDPDAFIASLTSAH
jgi:hypothetical protein